MEEKISEAIKAAMEAAPERKFVESVDISFTIKDVDLKNPNNRIKEEIRLPSGRGRELKVAMFAAGEAATKAKAAGIAVFSPQDIEDFGGKKGQAKKVANQYDFLPLRSPAHGPHRSPPRYRSWSTWQNAPTRSSNPRPRHSRHRSCRARWLSSRVTR